jgi:uncharacterized protein YegL
MGLFGFGNNGTTAPTGDKKAARSVPVIKDAAGGSAVSLEKVETTGSIDLRKKTEAVAFNLGKKGMGGIRAQVMVILDHSYSMSNDYENGKVQDLVERFLGFGLAVDVDGEIPVVAFDSRIHSEVAVNLNNYKDIVNKSIYKPHNMGGTDLTAALQVVLKAAKKTDAPLYCAIITDGEPNDRTSAKKLVCELANYPVFIKFLAVQKVRFLEELDDLSNNERLLDNVDTKEYIALDAISDDRFAADMVDEWDSWVNAALSAGTLTQ